MEVEEIRAVVEAFRQAAARAREAGFDGVEIQGEVSFLLAQFMSPRPDGNRHTGLAPPGD